MMIAAAGLYEPGTLLIFHDSECSIDDDCDDCSCEPDVLIAPERNLA
jgi:hypothetical protein